MIAVVNGRLALPTGVIERGTLIADAGKIVEIGSAGDVAVHLGADVVDAHGGTVLPGFIDVHVHGGGGGDAMDGTPDSLRAICRTHAKFGTTGLLATTITQSGDEISRALRNVRDVCEMGANFSEDGARILGVHLEGPYLCRSRAGAQPLDWVRDYDAEEWKHWSTLMGDWLKLITLAPERPGGDELIAACRQAGMVVSIGHTDADADQTRGAIKRGARHATHLFNAMPPIHHRHPGPIPQLLSDDHVFVEVIADGLHVAPDVIRMILKAKGPERVVLITDAMRGAGMGDGVYDLGGQSVTVVDGKATLADGTLAGSVLTMAQAASNARSFLGIGWCDVARLTSMNAADEMGWKTKGRLSVGCDADFAVVNDAVEVQATYVAGRCVYQSS